MTRKPEKLGAYYFGCLLVYVWEEFMRKILLVFGTEIECDKDQLNCILTPLDKPKWASQKG